MKADEFDDIFDNGGDVIGMLDMSTATRPGLQDSPVRVVLPAWMVQSLDLEARRLGVTRQSIIKFWIAERLERKAA